MKMIDASKIDSEYFVEGIELLEQNDVFSHPLRSSLIHIFGANVSCTAQQSNKVNIKDIKCKFFPTKEYPGNENLYVFIPVLHTEI